MNYYQLEQMKKIGYEVRSIKRLINELNNSYWTLKSALIDYYCTYIGHNFVKIMMWIIVKLNPYKCSELASIIHETAGGYQSDPCKGWKPPKNWECWQEESAEDIRERLKNISIEEAEAKVKLFKLENNK